VHPEPRGSPDYSPKGSRAASPVSLPPSRNSAQEFPIRPGGLEYLENRRAGPTTLRPFDLPHRAALDAIWQARAPQPLSSGSQRLRTRSRHSPRKSLRLRPTRLCLHPSPGRLRPAPTKLGQQQALMGRLHRPASAAWRAPVPRLCSKPSRQPTPSPSPMPTSGLPCNGASACPFYPWERPPSRSSAACPSPPLIQSMPIHVLPPTRMACCAMTL
jgi:hypothetical protein